MTPSDLTSPFCSAIATAIVSAWTSKPTNFILFIDRLLSLVALYCLSSDSQHNPRLRIGAGHSILTKVIRPESGPESGFERQRLFATPTRMGRSSTSLGGDKSHQLA